jgi:hypothetical protein
MDLHELTTLGVVAYALSIGIDWNHLLNSSHAMTR